MTFNERLTAYDSIMPQWVKDLPKDLIAEIEANGFKCYDAFTNVSFGKDFTRLAEYRVSLKQNEFTFYLPNVSNAQELPAHIENIKLIMRWHKIYTEHLNQNL